jgi:hypothetical protein
METKELSGALLDYWVARAVGWTWERVDGWAIRVIRPDGSAYDAGTFRKRFDADTGAPLPPITPFEAVHADGNLRYSTDWAQGGPIIEKMLDRSKLEFSKSESGVFLAVYPKGQAPFWYHTTGDTELQAAMRAYVASVYGDTVPDEATR